MDTTLGCLTTYNNWLDISKFVGVDELSHRSDKERYLMTVLFAYGFTHPILKDFESDEFSEALDKIVNDLHDGIKKEKKLKKKLFNTIGLDALDTLETCVWLSKQKMDKTMHTMLITTAHISYLIVNKISVPNTDQDHQLIKNGSKLEIDKNFLFGLASIFQDTEIRITNFIEGIKRP